MQEKYSASELDHFHQCLQVNAWSSFEKYFSSLIQAKVTLTLEEEFSLKPKNISTFYSNRNNCLVKIVLLDLNLGAQFLISYKNDDLL